MWERIYTVIIILLIVFAIFTNVKMQAKDISHILIDNTLSLMERQMDPESVCLMCKDLPDEIILEIAYELFSGWAAVDKNKKRELITCLCSNHPKIKKELLLLATFVVNPIERETGNTIAHVAAEQNVPRLIDLLLQHKFPLFRYNKQGFMPIHCAVSNIKVFEKLLKHDLTLANARTSQENTIAHVAINKNKPEVLRLIKKLKKEELFQVKNGDGYIPLLYAAKQNKKDYTIVLHKLGSSLHEKDVEGRTALHWAVMNNNTQLINYLLQHNVPLQADGRGKTPLFYAIENGNNGIAQQILAQCKGIDINTQDNLGNSIMHYAVQNPENVNLVTDLVLRAPDTTLKNNKGEFFLTVACSACKEQLNAYQQDIEYLKKIENF